MDQSSYQHQLHSQAARVLLLLNKSFAGENAFRPRHPICPQLTAGKDTAGKGTSRFANYSMTDTKPSIFLHQIYFKSDQRGYLEPTFIPFDNSQNPNPEWHEYQTFLSESARGHADEQAYYGYVSWKFHMKTGVRGDEFLDFVRSHPGADVYFINPFHEYSLCFKNVWAQGDHFHPGLSELAQDVFQTIGYDFSLAEMVNSEADTAFCNYWIAKPTFWRTYIPYLTPILELAVSTKHPALAARLNAPVPRHPSATYLTFILERVFTSLVWRDKIDAHGYPFSEAWFHKRYGNIYDQIAPLRLMKERERCGTLSDADRQLLEAHRSLFIKYKEVEFSHKLLNTPLTRWVQRIAAKLPLRRRF